MAHGREHEIGKAPERVWTDRSLDVVSGEESNEPLLQVDIEVIGPEIGHHLLHLTLAHDVTRELDEREGRVVLAVEGPKLPAELLRGAPLFLPVVAEPSSTSLDGRHERVAVRAEQRIEERTPLPARRAAHRASARRPFDSPARPPGPPPEGQTIQEVVRIGDRDPAATGAGGACAGALASLHASGARLWLSGARASGARNRRTASDEPPEGQGEPGTVSSSIAPAKDAARPR